MAKKGTTFRQNIRIGEETGVPATRTIGAVPAIQRTDVSSVPLSGARVFTLPSSAVITAFRIYNSSGAGEHSVRFGAVGSTGSNFYGSVAISAAGVYVVTNPSTSGSVWMIGASSQPIGISVVSGSGAIAGVANNLTVNVEYYQKYEKFDT